MRYRITPNTWFARKFKTLEMDERQLRRSAARVERYVRLGLIEPIEEPEGAPKKSTATEHPAKPPAALKPPAGWLNRTAHPETKKERK